MKTHNIIENTLQEYELKYYVDYSKDVRVNCVVEFSDKMKNERKKIISHWNIIGGS